MAARRSPNPEDAHLMRALSFPGCREMLAPVDATRLIRGAGGAVKPDPAVIAAPTDKMQIGIGLGPRKDQNEARWWREVNSW